MKQLNSILRTLPWILYHSAPQMSIKTMWSGVENKSHVQTMWSRSENRTSFASPQVVYCNSCSKGCQGPLKIKISTQNLIHSRQRKSDKQITIYAIRLKKKFLCGIIFTKIHLLSKGGTVCQTTLNG